MSDSERDSGSEEGSDDESNVSEVDSEEERQQKQLAVEKDVKLLNDIFAYISQTTQRITANFTLQDELAKLSTTKRELEATIDRIQLNSDSDDDSNSRSESKRDSISWSQYESLNDAKRAQLLEKAIHTLKKGKKS